MNDYRRHAVVEETLARYAAGQAVVPHAGATVAYLQSTDLRPEPIVALDAEPAVFDFSRGSLMLGEPLKGMPVERLSRLVDRHLAAHGTRFGFGRWGERRELYVSELFVVADGKPMRDVHLGIDVFCAPGTSVHAPLAGRVRVKANNASELDYGPLLILEHVSPAGDAFFSLYGHLALNSITHWVPGQSVAAGEKIAAVGAPPENGNWPPHLHFQLIIDLLGLGKDFPGVAAHSERNAWFALSPLPEAFFPLPAAVLDGRDDQQ